MESLKLIPQDRQSIDFAESERQKSKNLLVYPYTGKIASPDITITENGDGSFTINGQKTLTETNSVYFLYAFNNWTDKISSFKLSAGTYTGKLFASIDADIQLVLTDGSMYQNIDVNKNTTFTVAKDTYFEIYLQVPKHNTSVFNNLVVYPMIVKGTDLGEWQPYNGAIVHEKEIKPILIYDIDKKQTPTGLTSAYSSGIKFADGVNIPIGNFNYFNIYTRTKNNVKKKTTINKTFYYWGDCFLGFNENWVLSYFGILFIIENNSLSMAEAGYTAIHTSTYTNKNQSEDVVVYRIEGGY